MVVICVPPFRFFRVGRVLNGAPAGIGSGGDPAGPWDNVSQGVEHEKRSHSMVKLYERKRNYFLLCDVCR